MYNILYQIVSHPWESSQITNTTEQQIYMYTCCALIIILTVVFIDMIYRVFAHFWRG